MNNKDVAKAWSENRFCVSSTENYRTDGFVLWSYNLKIGYTHYDKKILIDYTTRGGFFKSMTTSTKHVSLASKVCDYMVRPLAYLDKGEDCYLESEQKSNNP